MKRKMMAIILVLVLTFAMTACGGGGSDAGSDSAETGAKKEAPAGKAEEKASEKAEIVLGIWDENQKDTLQVVVDRFNESSETAHATIELTPWSSYWTKLDAAANAGEAPDVFWMNVFLPKYVKGDVLLPLDDYIANDGVDMGGYVEATVNMYNYEGKQWGMPKGLDSVAVAYNKGIFDKYGVAYPEEGWTWDDMKATAEELRAAMEAADSGEYPILMELDAQPSHFNFIAQTGGFVINDDYTKSGYNLPETVEAYQNVMDLFEGNLLAPYNVLSETKGTDLFLSEKGAMLYVGSWKTKVLEEAAIGTDEKVGLITMPSQSASNASVLGSLSYTVFKHTEHPDAAWELVKFMTGEEGNKIQAEAGIDIPALKSAQEYYLGNFSNIDASVYFKAAENAVGFPAGPHLTLWLDPLNGEVARIFAGEVTPKEGCDNIYKEMQQIIDEN